MSNFLLIISVIFCVGAMAADVHSTWINNRIPQIVERNRHFRRSDGHCDIGKLIGWKMILLTVISAAVFGVMQMKDGDKFAFLVFLLMALITGLTARKNYQLHKKYK